MENIVELVCNPYTKTLRILINNNEISQYSPIRQYQDEPIWIWCDSILHDIYEECGNSPYTLIFTGRYEDHVIMKALSEQFLPCTYIYKEYENNKSFQERMKELSIFLRNSQGIQYSQCTITALFSVSKKYISISEVLKDLTIENAFCKVQSNVTELFGRRAENAENLFVIADDIDIEILNAMRECRFIFFIKIENESHFEQKKGNVYIFQSTKEDVLDTIFLCLKYASLLLAFMKCLNEIKSFAKNNINLTKEITKVTSIEDELQVFIENTEIEVGTSIDVNIRTIKGVDVSKKIKLQYSIDGIVEYTGISFVGRKCGKTRALFFREGELYPFHYEDISVVKYNRIQEIRLIDSKVRLGMGDRYNIEYAYIPLDADNIDKIKWISSNTSVAIVDNFGRVTAISTGESLIYCTAEKVSSRCLIQVKPYMEEIILGELEITMRVGETKELNISYSPANCFDNTIILESSSLQTVNVVGYKLTAVGEGNAEIHVYNGNKSIHRIIHVTCIRVRQEKVNIPKKRGILAKLFGL